MARKAYIDQLLRADKSPQVAQQLIDWADETQGAIDRGEMMIGLLTLDEVMQIPVAYRRAVECGVSSAWLRLANWHASPRVGEPELELAEEALASAIAANVPGAKLALVQTRWFCKQDTATAKEKVEAHQYLCEMTAADPQDAVAHYFLGMLTTQGFGVAAAPQKGAALLRQAADLGNADAMFEYYIYLSTGTGIAKDEAAALQFLIRAAEAGQPRAMYNLGAYHAVGRGMPKNIPAAIDWYERAAAFGNPQAMVGLATIYGLGDGVEQDLGYAEEMIGQAEYYGMDVNHLRERLNLHNP
jgi:hypothetical protein